MIVLSVIALIWAANICCIVMAARACSISLSHVVVCAALLGPLAWIVFCLKLRELAPGRVSILPSPLRKVAAATAVYHTIYMSSLNATVLTFHARIN